MSTSSGPNLFNQLVSRQINSRNSSIFPSMIFRERLKVAKNLFKTDLVGHYGCVNAIEFSNGGKYLVSGGDDKRVLLWDVEKSLAGYESPISMDKEHQSNIFCLGFDRTNSKVFSGGNDELVIVHDFETKKVVDVFIHQKPVYGLSVDPTCDSILATASEDGKITIYDQRKSAAVQIFGKFGGSRQASFHAVQFHPYDGNFLVTANTRRGAAFWDIRSTSKPLIQYGGEENQKSCMSVRFNSNGTLVLALRRRLPPILYNTISDTPICQFYHPDYYNSCTMKSCCFAGEDDEFVLSGSDDFNLYVWRVGDIDLDQSHQWIEKTQMVLYGHRSIVNQVRYNPEKCLLASSGVEKIVKIWSPFEQNCWTGSLIDEVTCSDNPREVFTHDAYLSLASANMSHDYSTQNTQEDSRMMAFFDSLIQQEIEQWNTTNYSSDTCQFSNNSSDERSTRHTSTDDSEEDQNMNSFFTNLRNRNRRGSVTNIKPQRNKYTNRIAYLIATKRNTLKRLALKGASNSRRRQNILKTKKKIHSRNNLNHSVRTSRSGNSQKRTARYMPSVSFRNRTGSNSNNIETSDLKATRQKRYDAVFRALRRKHRSRRHVDPSDTSSDDDDVDVSFNYEPPRSTNIAIPSTSTGITSSGRDIIIRLRQQEQLLDSEYYDDDDDEEASNHNNSNANSVNSIVQNNINNNNQNNVPHVILNGRTNHNNNNVVHNNHHNSYNNNNNNDRDIIYNFDNSNSNGNNINNNNNIENNNHNVVNNVNSYSSSFESDRSSSNVETDSEDLESNNHLNNNTDIISNNLVSTGGLQDTNILVAENTENPINNDIAFNNSNNLNNVNSNNNNKNKHKNNYNNLKNNNYNNNNPNNIDVNNSSNKVTRKRLQQDLALIGEASSSSSFLSTTNRNDSSVKNFNMKNNLTNSSARNLYMYSSHSNSRLSNSDYLEDDSNSLSNESSDCFISNNNTRKNLYSPSSSCRKRRRISSSEHKTEIEELNDNINENIINNNDNAENIYHNQIVDNENVEFDPIDANIVVCNKSYFNSFKSNKNNIKKNIQSDENGTPKKYNKFNGFSKTFIPLTPDSGINITPSCSSVTTSTPESAGHSNTKNNRNVNENIPYSNGSNCNSINSDKFSVKLFHQKMSRVRRNYRNKFGDDSESD